jgi:hypothetical protein
VLYDSDHNPALFEHELTEAPPRRPGRSGEKLIRVSAEMLTDNVAMQVITKHLGFRVRASEDLTSVRAFLDL